MADKNDAIEVDAILVPELGDMGAVERQLSKKLSAAAKPLVDTLSNAKVGLDPRALRKAQKELNAVGDSLAGVFDSALEKVLTQDRSVLRSPKGLKALAKSDAGVAHMINVLGGYQEASKILASPDAQRRLQVIGNAFKSVNDTAFQISRLPTVDAKTQKLLAKLYQSNSAESFKKLTANQQQQVRDALAVIDLQDKAFASVRNSLAKAGLGVAATEVNKAMKERRENAKRLVQVTSPAAMAKLEKDEANVAKRMERQAKLQKEKQARLDASSARSRAVSEEKDRVLGRTGGISGLKDKQDIDAVRRGLNRDYNFAVQQLAVDAMGGGKSGKAYRASEERIAQIQRMRAELTKLETDQRRMAKYEQDMLKEQRRQLELKGKAEVEAAKKAQQAVEKEQLRNRPARNARQAQAILRSAGGDIGQLEKDQIRTVRPYLQDRFQARSRYAEAIGGRYGTDSPEFSRAAKSAQDYAAALGELDNRSRSLRPALDDVAQITRAFFRYALGYGALYQMLAGVTALGRGLVDLDEQLYNIQAITLSTDAQMRTIEGSIKQVGLTTKFTLNEVADAAKVLAQAGTAPEAIPQQLKAVADFAAATNSSLEQSADLLTSFNNVYKEISDGKAADLLTKALNLSKLQGEDLRTIVSYTAQTAEGYNISAENLLGAVATLRNTGIKPSTIATGLRQAMLEVFNPDKKLTEALAKRYEQMGEKISNEQIAARFDAFTASDNPLLSAVAELRRLGFGGEASNLFSRAFDVRAFNPLKALVNNFDEFSQLSTQVGIGQSASEASEIQLQSLRATLENLGASVVAFSDSVGGDMVRSLQSGAQAAAELIQSLTELDQKMKLETGEGLSSVIGTGLLGGAAGALLGGKGALNRVGGFATGAVAAGGLATAGEGEGGGAGDYAIPALAALLTVVPSLMDFVGGLRGRASEIKAAAAKMKAIGKVDAASTLGPALGAGAFLADLVSNFGSSKLRGLGGIGAMGVLRVGAGLVVRAIPVIGLIWTAYEILSMFSGSADKLQSAVDKARNQADAAGARVRTLEDRRQKTQADVDEFDVDAAGGPKQGTTASRLINLERQAENVDLAVAKIFDGKIGELGEADKILTEFVDRSTSQRQEDLDALRSMGYEVSDREVFDISSQLEELGKGVEAVRKELLADLTRATEQLVAAGSDDKAREAALVRQRVMNEFPELRELVYGRATLPLDQVLELYREYARRMSEEAAKGLTSTQERVDAVVAQTIAQLDAIALSAADSPEVRDSAEQLVSTLEATEQNVVTVLSALENSASGTIGKIEAQIARVQKELERAKATPALSYTDEQVLNERIKALSEELGGLQRQLTGRKTLSDASAKGAKIAEEFDQKALTEARGEVANRQESLGKAVAEGLFTEEFLDGLTARQAELVNRLSTDQGRAELAAGMEPVRRRTGEYDQSVLSKDLEKVLEANSRFWATQTARTEQQAKEDAKAPFLSDPKAQVRLAELQNQLSASDRRRDYDESKKIVEEMFGLQRKEQEKALKRAEMDLRAKQGDPGKDDTAAREKVFSEQAKLESLRGDMLDKLLQYQEKIDELDLKRRTVEVNEEKRRAEGGFREAVERGDIDAAKKASEEYSKALAKATELAEKELSLKGYSADQIKLEIRTREGLTTTLLDQEGAQKRLTDAIIARADFEARAAGTGPSTGNKAVDGFLEGSGIGFTQAQEEEAMIRDLQIYVRQVNSLKDAWAQQQKQLVRGTDEASAAEQAYLQKIEDVQFKLGETAAQLQQLRNTPWQEVKEGFNLTALIIQLEQSNYALQNFGENIRNTLGQGLEDLGGVFANTIRNSGDLAKILGITRDEAYSTSDALKEVVNTMAEQAFQDSSRTLFNSLAKGGLNLASKGWGALTGKGGDAASGAQAEDGAKSGLFGVLGGLFNGEAAESATGTMNVSAQTVNVNGSGGMGGATDSVADAMQEKVGGPLASGFELLRGKFDQVTGKLGEVGNLLWQGLVNIVTSIFTASAAETTASAASGAAGAASGFASGGQPSRVIKGKKSLERDNLMATAEVNGKNVPIRVESEEGILNRKAMDLIGGEAGLNAINSGQITRVRAAPSPVQPATSGAEQVAQTIKSSPVVVPAPEFTILNVNDQQQVEDYVGSRRGTKMIINNLRKEGVL